MSGESNVLAWLKERGLEPDPARVAAILRAAKSANHVLTDAEIRAVLAALPPAAPPPPGDAKAPAPVKS